MRWLGSLLRQNKNPLFLEGSCLPLVIPPLLGAVVYMCCSLLFCCWRSHFNPDKLLNGLICHTLKTLIYDHNSPVILFLKGLFTAPEPFLDQSEIFWDKSYYLVSTLWVSHLFSLSMKITLCKHWTSLSDDIWDIRLSSMELLLLYSISDILTNSFDLITLLLNSQLLFINLTLNRPFEYLDIQNLVLLSNYSDR